MIGYLIVICYAMHQLLWMNLEIFAMDFLLLIAVLITLQIFYYMC